jgi:hypothetical protein
MSGRPRLETTLVNLGRSIAWPTSSPHLAEQVSARIESEPIPAVAHRPRRLALALAALLVVTLVFVVSPSARQAVADLFGAAGIRIGLTSETTPATGAGFDLGEPISVDSLRGTVDFQVRMPVGDEPGAPDGIYLGPDGRVTMVWAGSPTLPSAGDTGIGLLLAQYQAMGDVSVGEKTLGAESRLEELTVEGRPAVWVEGAEHVLTWLDAEGNPMVDASRLAANVLLWESRGVNHRLETTGDLESALGIVSELEPVS